MLGFVVAIVPDVMVLGSSGSTFVMDQEIPLKKCRYSRAYSMIQVRCSDLNLNEIPTDLKSDIQILDASKNRFRELTNDSLARYKSLSYLYLNDNFMITIHEAAFDNLRYLEVLDLTMNGFADLPKSLFSLPYLRKVYLAGNQLPDYVFNLEVKSPLTFLQLSKNKLCKIPQFDPLPSLVHLNVSWNSIRTISTEDLAPFCSLKVLDLTGNPVHFDVNTCGCQLFNSWLKEREIRSYPVYNCTAEQAAACSQVKFSNRTMELYANCTKIMQLKIETEQARNTWILVASCVSAFIFCLFVALFCVHKRNKTRKRKIKEEQRIAVNNANTELLNSNLNQPENT